MSERILITGAAGTIGTMLRPRMARPQRFLRLLDIAPIPHAQPWERVETVAADITDFVPVLHPALDVGAVVHPRGICLDVQWGPVLDTHGYSSFTMLGAGRRAV